MRRMLRDPDVGVNDNIREFTPGSKRPRNELVPPARVPFPMSDNRPIIGRVRIAKRQRDDEPQARVPVPSMRVFEPDRRSASAVPPTSPSELALQSQLMRLDANYAEYLRRDLRPTPPTPQSSVDRRSISFERRFNAFNVNDSQVVTRAASRITEEVVMSDDEEPAVHAPAAAAVDVSSEEDYEEEDYEEIEEDES